MLAFSVGLFAAWPARAVGKPTLAPMGLHVVGHQLLDGANRPIIVRGVNRSGSEYACIQGWGFFDGPSDLASVQAIAAWGANAVRIPLNEGCWLNINGAPPAYSGAAYHNAIAGYVATVQAAGLVPILELHWTGAGTTRATGQQPMLNRDHSVTFWQQVAAAYRNNTGVVFDLHNEPYPDDNRDTAAAWDCWKNGTTPGNAAVCPGGGLNYQAAGMQELVNAVRATGATNPIMLGGVQYSNALSRWLTYKPQDPTGNLVAAWHVYNFNICNSTSCYDATAAPVAAVVPLVAGEIGQNDCGTAMLTTLMAWLDGHNAGYLAWTWDTWGTACTTLSLIVDYAGSPTAYGRAYRDHLRSVAPPPATATPVPPTPTMSRGQRFTDVPPGSVFYDQINWCYDRGIISGYSNGDGTYSFRPANDSTRGQVSKILVNAMGWPLVSPGTPHFTDVPLTHPFYTYVETAYSHGVISGYSDGTFRPQSNVTRAQIAKMIVAAQGWSLDTSGGPHFSDVTPANPFYAYIETAYHHNVITGYSDGTFRPFNNLTRGQLAKLIYGMLSSPQKSR
jgi:hypothetical protein